MKTNVIERISAAKHLGVSRFAVASAIAATLLSVASPALASDSAEGQKEVKTDGPAGGQVTSYLPADFDRFAPRNALDMLQNVPGFTVRDEGQGRGLGQASENVLINGDRLASKSDSATTQLARIAAKRVTRIDIVDGATFGIPGLSGQVANVIVESGGVSGQFEYRAIARPKYALDSYGGGEVSVSGSSGNIDWTAAYTHDVGRGGGGGGKGTFIYDAAGNLLEQRDTLLWFKGEFPKLSGQLKYASPNGTTANLNASYGWDSTRFNHDEWRYPVGETAYFRDFLNRDDGYNYDISADVEFGLGPGRLKLIGIERFSQSDGPATSYYVFDDGSPTQGSWFWTDSKAGERIGRAEYSWAMLGGDWQLDGEAAFNRLDRIATVGDLGTDGEFDIVPFPGGTGKVTEDRYEAILTHNRNLAPDLTLQIGGGYEYSKLAQSGDRGLTREFWRPKGSVTLAWAANPKFDLSFKLARTVGQLSFGTFLATVDLQGDNDNAGNIRLVPQQAWEVDIEAKKDLGPWGSANLRAYARFIDDFIDIIPVAGGESSGNIDGKAELYGIRADLTLNLDRLGWKGARLTSGNTFETTSLPDPLTGIDRPFSGHRRFRSDTELRWDIPKSDWAFGAGFNASQNERYVRLYETGRDYEGPIYTYAYVENKDVLGLTVNLQAFNLTAGESYFNRTVYDGLRDRSPVLFRENRRVDVSTIFRLSVKGNF